MLVIQVNATKEQSVEAHVGEEAGVGIRVTEWIDLPADSRLDAEFFENEVVTNHVIIDHVFIGRACLVMHGPASVGHLKLPALNQASHLVFSVFGLPVEPHGEELHFNLDEAACRILQEGVDHRVDGVRHSCPLDAILSTVKVLIQCLQPPDVVV